jgi:hypothetical protein
MAEDPLQKLILGIKYSINAIEEDKETELSNVDFGNLIPRINDTFIEKIGINAVFPKEFMDFYEYTKVNTVATPENVIQLKQIVNDFELAYHKIIRCKDIKPEDLVVYDALRYYAETTKKLSYFSLACVFISGNVSFHTYDFSYPYKHTRDLAELLTDAFVFYLDKCISDDNREKIEILNRLIATCKIK